MVTGHVGVLVLATSSLSPCQNWSVLLDTILIFIISCEIARPKRLISSLKRRKPEKLKRQGVANHKSDSDPDSSVSWTIASNVPTETGSFLTTGFVSDRCKPSHKRICRWCYARKYLVTILSAQLYRMVLGSLLASSGSSNS